MVDLPAIVGQLLPRAAVYYTRVVGSALSISLQCSAYYTHDICSAVHYTMLLAVQCLFYHPVDNAFFIIPYHLQCTVYNGMRLAGHCLLHPCHLQRSDYYTMLLAGHCLLYS